ncbi:MATE family efflux transporter [Roseitranquillus sediminis]|uniref:MATE family efflux transporter n=1 Tax=Roseitranquillus sediminis TaxID=2809051 RepID=UPI001D0C09AC|nr:MATE family efflux transporter [Roseitranquillus sediminis]MBM9595746.1 MATE family efflux transporter [Roseitranquillus sediminis]
MTELAGARVRDESVWRHAADTLWLGLPLIGSHLAQFTVSIVDTVMLGWYGIEALAAVVVGSSFFFLLLIMGSGFAWAVMPLVSAEAAAGADAQVRRVTRMGIWLSILFAMLALPAMLWGEPILLALGQSAQVSADAGLYLAIMWLGLPPALAANTLKSYLAALGRTGVVLVVTVVAAIFNGLLNWALIFGNWGAPELGLTGAAWASVLAQWATLVVIGLYVRQAMPQHAMFQRFWRPDWEAFFRVLRLGWPIGITALAEVGLFSASALMMGWIGTIELAAHGIAIQIASVTFLFHLGLSNAATIRAGAALGRDDPEGLRRGALAAAGLSAVWALATVVLFLTVPGFLIALFLDPADAALPAVLAVGVTLLALAALFQLADAAQVMALGLLRGIQDTRVPMIHAAVGYWLIGMSASYVLAFPMEMGAPGIWLGLVLGLTVAGVLLSTRFWRLAVRRRPVGPAPS